MKKIFLSIAAILLLSGCGKEEMLTCTRENKYNGLTSGTEYKVTYIDDEVKHVTITYNYNQDTHTDGVDTGTDGTTSDDDTSKNGIVDGKVGEAVDNIIGGVYNTVLDLSGLKEIHTNQINNTSIKGFTSKVVDNTASSYKVIYELDLTKISDTDINKFNVNRSKTKLIDTYTTQGLTCK